MHCWIQTHTVAVEFGGGGTLAFVLFLVAFWNCECAVEILLFFLCVFMYTWYATRHMCLCDDCVCVCSRILCCGSFLITNMLGALVYFLFSFLLLLVYATSFIFNASFAVI